MSTAHLNDRQMKSLVISTTAGVYGRVAVNPDGTPIGSLIGGMQGLVLHTTAFANNLIVAAPAYLLAVRGYNGKAVLQVIQTHNSATLPANGAIPKEAIKAIALENFFIEPVRPVFYSAGICVCNSGTVPTKTIGGTDCWFTIEYILA